LTNVGLLRFAVEVTLLGGDENVPFVPFEGGEGFVPVRAARAPKYAGLRLRVSSIMQAEPVPGNVDGTHENYNRQLSKNQGGSVYLLRHRNPKLLSQHSPTRKGTLLLRSDNLSSVDQ
jgi:hypothetical protein